MFRTSISQCLGVFLRSKSVLIRSENFKLTGIISTSASIIGQATCNSRCLYAISSQRHWRKNNKMATAECKKKGDAKSGQKKNEKSLRVVRMREHKLQHGGDKWPPVSLQIIGCGTKDSTASIMIIAGIDRIMFNCGEGVQRLLLENGIKSMSKFEHLFFTRMSWDNVGGAIGMAVGLKAVGVPRVHLHGPPQLDNLIDTFQSIVRYEKLEVEPRPYTEGEVDFGAGILTPVPLFANTGTQTEETAVLSSSNESSDENESKLAPDKRKPRQDRRSSRKKRRVPASNMTVAYVCKLHSKPGKLLMNKIKEFGVKPRGHHLNDLKKGIAHTTEDGRVVKPEDVLGPCEPEIYFIVLECPSVDYIEAVTTNEVFARHHAENGSDTAKIIIHMCPQEVMDSLSYVDWMKKFGPSTEHVVLNRSSKSPVLIGANRLQTKLNLLHQEIFPPLVGTDTDVNQNQGASTSEVHTGESTRLQQAETYNMYHLRPDLGWKRENIPITSDYVKEYLKEVEELPPEFHTSLTDLKKHLETLPSSHGNNKFPELVFTGTGSAIPMRDRNVSGILLNISETQSLILDCGEGTYGQLYRFYGNDHIDDVIARIQCIFVSHKHLDHHSGTIAVIREWNRIMDERGEIGRILTIVGPTSLEPILAIYDAECESIRFKERVRFVDLKALSYFEFDRAFAESSPNPAPLMKSLGLTKFDTVPVRHCYNSHAVVLTHNIVQDGSWHTQGTVCLQTDSSKQARRNADLLIHEATLEDGMEEEAQLKKHSMISEAIEVGNQMNAKFTLLTHFSQRYMKIPYFKSEVKGDVGIAYDNMRVSLSELPILPKLLPVLTHLFADKISEMTKERHKKAEKDYLVNMAKMAAKNKASDKS